VLFFLLYYILTISGENMVNTGFISAFAGSWMSSFVLTPLGIWLTIKAANDSVLFDREAYKRFFSSFSRRGKSQHEGTSTLQ
jgi:lipopolysaccharide export system permease protein